MRQTIVGKPPTGITSLWIQKALVKIEKKLPSKLGISKQELTLVFVGRMRAQSLNFQYRKKDYPTDILSFDGMNSESLGELVFCRPVLIQQARKHRLSIKNEFLYLLIHGILHLLGFEHERSEKDARIMFRLQDKLFRDLRD